ncbi:MAG: hypothetical protein WBR56_03485, partial [Sedimenticolaceae bacterium]
RLGGHVSRGDPIGRLWVPDNEGVVESVIAAATAARIRTGQTAEVALRAPGNGLQMKFRGRVASLINGADQDASKEELHKVRIRIDIPDKLDALASTLRPGNSGYVKIDTDGQPVWRYVLKVILNQGTDEQGTAQGLARL